MLYVVHALHIKAGQTFLSSTFGQISIPLPPDFYLSN
jgi:hypothetical protein